jgi:hypothetical protein
MTLEDLLRSRLLQGHRTSLQEVAELFELAERDLADAEVESISADRRFSAAYEAALALATIPLYCAGYRTRRGEGHHRTTFEALPLVMGEETQGLADLLETCRTKRHTLSYRRVGQATVEEVRELIEATRALQAEVRRWLEKSHPGLAGGSRPSAEK